MPKLNYVIDENDIEAVRGLDETAKNSPDPKIVIDMQNTLSNALQPVQMPQGEAQPPANANANWGKAAQG